MDIPLKKISLRFCGEERGLEESFQKKYFHDSLTHLRHCHLYAVLFYICTGGIDYYVYQGQISGLLLWRFVIVVFTFLIGYIFTFSKVYQSFWQYISVGYILVTGGSFITLTVLAPSPQAYDYYVGVFFCLMFGYTFIRERFVYASLAGNLLIVSYVIAVTHNSQMPDDKVFVSCLYLITANFLGMLIARHLERLARSDFFFEYKLRREQDKVVNLNDNLERKVSERTKELTETHDRLRQEVEQREEVEKRLIHAHKMEAIGNLAGGIAHDFNNILSAIIGYTELSIDLVEKDSPVEKNLQKVFAAGERAKGLVKQILAFARQTDEEVKPVRMDLIIKEALNLIRSTIPTSIEIRSSLKSKSLVMGDPISIHQIIMNLCTNAAHAMPNGGVIEVSLIDQVISSQEEEKSSLPDGEYLKLIVSDTGTGISPDIIDSIFEPYFTTKSVGAGTGMGLAMVHGIIEKYKGRIGVTSEVGQGCVFEVMLPTIQAEEKPTYRNELLPGGNEAILVVDDESEVASAESQVLASLGYRVTTASSSSSALDIFRNRPGDFDLVITDMTMPVMTGDQLAAKLIQMRPDLPIILCSGYSDKISEQSASEIGVKTILDKPLSKSDLAHTVRLVLDQSNSDTT